MQPDMLRPVSVPSLESHLLASPAARVDNGLHNALYKIDIIIHVMAIKNIFYSSAHVVNILNCIINVVKEM